jgi:ATP-dependent DNA helicase RecG
MGKLNLSHRPTFRKNYLHPALEAGLIEMTLPDSPRSPTQKYFLTEKGKRMLAKR